MMYVVTSGPAKRRKQAALAYEQGVLTYVNVVVLAHAIKKRKCLYDMALCSAAPPPCSGYDKIWIAGINDLRSSLCLNIFLA